MSQIDCGKCGKCCSYVSIQIDTPEDFDDFENIRWYLLHENMYVYVDHEDDWCVEFKAKCKFLKDRQCTYYDKRPQICREHSPETCEKEDDESPYKHLFTDVTEFEDYLNKNKLKK